MKKILIEVSAGELLDKISILHIKLKTRISNEGFLSLSVQETRSQLKNKQIQFIIDPDLSYKEIDIGFISDPIFWGHDVAVKPILTSESHHQHAKKVVYFDRGYDLVNSKPNAIKISSSRLLLEKLIKGEADLAIMPLRLARAHRKELHLYS